MSDSSKRFEFSGKKGVFEDAQVIVDKKTGVQYLFVTWGYAGGLTVLLDRDGKPLVDPDFAG
ncbi:MAG: hypothetical protein IJU75_01950 [Clostridia bacterium]|nr:hypothetical protein [Clostridia bacterium]MBQ7603695.1 hypothetical protein [Clostridia bacterium]